MTKALSFLILTAVAAGAGIFGGLQVYRLGAAAAERPSSTEAAPALPKGKSNVRDLKAIVTNLATPTGAWVRLEAAIVVDPEDAEIDRLVSEITADTLAYLRTLSLSDLAGAEGLRNLREDLSERAAIRSNRRVREMILQTLVVQ